MVVEFWLRCFPIQNCTMSQYVVSFMIDFLVHQLLSNHALAHSHTTSWPFCNKGEHLSKLFWLISFPIVLIHKARPGSPYQPPTILSTWASSAHQRLLYIKIKDCEGKVSEPVCGQRKHTLCLSKKKSTHRLSFVCAFSLLTSVTMGTDLLLDGERSTML